HRDRAACRDRRRVRPSSSPPTGGRCPPWCRRNATGRARCRKGSGNPVGERGADEVQASGPLTGDGGEAGLPLGVETGGGPERGGHLHQGAEDVRGHRTSEAGARADMVTPAEREVARRRSSRDVVRLGITEETVVSRLTRVRLTMTSHPGSKTVPPTV